MSQNDFNLANQGFPTMRSDMNSAFQALASNSSGATAPSITYAYQWWYDTGTNILKMRSSDNVAWISISFFDQTADAFRLLDDTQVVNTSGAQTGLLGDQSTATWETGTGTTESLVSPSKIKAAIDALASGGGFAYDAVSGATQDLDVGSFNFFDGGTLTADTTLTFSSVPTEAKWSYTANVGEASTYDLQNAEYTGKELDPSTELASPRGFALKDDGSKIYIVDGTSDAVHQYSLSTAWDLSTASYDSVSFNFASQDTNPFDLVFKSDGTKMFLVGSGNDSVYQYSLSTAWAVNTASYDSVSFSVASQETSPFGLTFKPDGTKMYIAGAANDRIFQYSLSTAWDLSTASYDSVSYNPTSPSADLYGVSFNPDGTKMFIVDSAGDNIYQYSLSTAWAVNTASYDSVSFSVSGQDTAPLAMRWDADGHNFYISGYSSSAIYQYTSATGYSLTLPSSVQNTPTLSAVVNRIITFDFYTADGGTNVYLIGEEAT